MCVPGQNFTHLFLFLYFRTELTSNYVRMLRDSEAEVRVAAAGKVASFSRFLTPVQIVRDIIPCVRELSMDSRCATVAAHHSQTCIAA